MILGLMWALPSSFAFWRVGCGTVASSSCLQKEKRKLWYFVNLIYCLVICRAHHDCFSHISQRVFIFLTSVIWWSRTILENTMRMNFSDKCAFCLIVSLFVHCSSYISDIALTIKAVNGCDDTSQGGTYLKNFSHNSGLKANGWHWILINYWCIW